MFALVLHFPLFFSLLLTIRGLLLEQTGLLCDPVQSFLYSYMHAPCVAFEIHSLVGKFTLEPHLGKIFHENMLIHDTGVGFSFALKCSKIVFRN